jgi:hypothetical protein
MDREEEQNDSQFLGTPNDETADGFLERRLAFIEEHFSYEELTGLSIDELENQRKSYNDYLNSVYSRFTHEDFVFADDLETYNAITDSEEQLFAPLSEPQQRQILATTEKIHRNFDKAYQDAKDRKVNRIASIMSSIPVVRRL